MLLLFLTKWRENLNVSIKKRQHLKVLEITSDLLLMWSSLAFINVFFFYKRFSIGLLCYNMTLQYWWLVSWNHSPPFWIWPIFNSIKWLYYQKDANQITLNHNSPRLSLSIFKVFVQILLNVNLSLNRTLLTFLLYVRHGWLNWFWQFLSERLSSFNVKGFCYSNMHAIQLSCHVMWRKDLDMFI